MKFLSLITLLLLTTACSKKAGQTSADFKLVLSGLSSLTGSTGGAMLWGKASDGASFSVNLNAVSDDLELDLRNETWDFYAITWDSPSSIQLDGTTSCAISKGNVLTGGEVSIDLNLSNTICENSDFTPSVNTIASKKTFPQIKLSSCKDINIVSGSQTCKNNLGSYNNGLLKSYRITLPEFTDGDYGDFTISNSPLTSACIVADPSQFAGESLLSSDELNIPIGNGDAPFRTVIRGYFDLNCGETRGYVEDTYEHGLFAPDHASGQILDENLKVQSYIESSLESYFVRHQLTTENACNLSTPQPGEFPTGLGTEADPYGICTPEQFNSVGDDPTLLSSSFELLKDLDFGGYSTGVFDPQGSLNCVGLGTSIIPFGGLDSDAICGTPITGPTPFTGSFIGNDFSMKNIFILEGDLSYLGIFRTMEGTVTNLNIENIHIEGNTYIGAISGLAENTMASITNTNVYKAEISADQDAGNSYVGGLVGKVGTIQLFTSNHLIEASIKADGNYIGGLVGYSNSHITNSSFTGNIMTENYQNSVSYVGGISGKQASGDITKSKSTGAIVASAYKVGGITGYIASGSNMLNNYSLMSIYNNITFPNQSVGGLVGEAGPSINISNSYFIGNVQTQCGSNDATCEVGSLVGTESATSITDSYSVENVSLGGLDGTVISYSSLETDTFSSITSPGWSWGFDWQTQLNGSLPRLSWETSDKDHCVEPINYSSITSQIAAGRGIESSPIEICSPTQFMDIKNYSNKYFALSSNINLGEFTYADSPTYFTNHLDGNEYILHNLSLVTSSTNEYGLIGSIGNTGSVKNLNIFSFDITSSTGENVGTLAGLNHGNIDNVRVIGSKTVGNISVGGVVGKNTGTMSNIAYNFGVAVIGANSVGGITGRNSGTITKSVSNGYFPIMSNATNGLGAVAGANEGTGIISEVSSSSTILISNDSQNIGGIVGINSGLIENTLTDTYSSILINYTPSSKIGGVVGSNEIGGTINNAIHLGSLPSSILSPSIGPIVGANSSSISEAFFSSRPYLNTVLESITITGASSSGTVCTISLQTTPASAAENHFVTVSTQDKMYEIQSIGASSIIINTSSDECSEINNYLGTMDYYDFSTSNVIGTYASTSELKSITHYCHDTIPTNDPDFRCTTGWDITQDEINGNGFNILKSVFSAELFHEERPTNVPKWLIEEGSYPELLFYW